MLSPALPRSIVMLRATRHLWLCSILCVLATARAHEVDWQFDPGLLRGSGLNAEMVQRFNRPNALLPGVYSMELHVNGTFSTRMDIRFAEHAQGGIRPCLDRALWLRIGVAEAHVQETEGDCPALSDQVAGSSFELDSARLRLSLSVPQILMRRAPRTAVNVDELDPGDSVLFVNYMGNGWHAERDGRIWAKHVDTGYLSLNGGINFGLWQYRQQGSLSLGNRSTPHWHNLGSHLQRPLPRLMGGSQLTLGQLYSSGHFFSGLAYHGLNLASDERLLSHQQRGFAPVVRGVAGSNAKVTIRQKGREIYQTTVAPGAFVIDDLAPTHSEGDLEVTVEEADGTVNTFKVPFAALPESLRPGHWRYHLALGRTRGHVDNSGFADLNYRQGVSNRISAGGGVRVALGYQALATDLVYLSRAGALGLTLGHSRARLPGPAAHAGWRAGASYSRTFAPTDTHLAIAAYRYSTSGYRDLGDVLGERFARRNGGQWQSSSYQQRARLDLSLSQSLGEYGDLFISGSMQNWHHSHQHERQWQLGYNTLLAGRVNLNLSLMRQYTARRPLEPALPGRTPAYQRETAMSLSLSMPLDGNTFSSGYSHSQGGGDQYDADLSGTVDRTSYHLGVSHAREDVWHASLQQRHANANLGINASLGPHHWQMAGNIQGALAVHRGGVTFGPWLGDTFALVEARGAKGARVGGTGQAQIDHNGYALVPALIPYRDNRVFLDPQDATGAIELDNAEQHSAPYPGAAVKLTFRARFGQALLIHVNAPGGRALPPGTEALDADGRSVGMLGQGNWLYLRSETARGEVQLRWGEGEQARCRLAYDSGDAPETPLLRLQATCVGAGDEHEAARRSVHVALGVKAVAVHSFRPANTT